MTDRKFPLWQAIYPPTPRKSDHIVGWKKIPNWKTYRRLDPYLPQIGDKIRFEWKGKTLCGPIVGFYRNGPRPMIPVDGKVVTVKPENIKQFISRK